ncbi:hypothetical protein ACG04R_26080 [Roseateles sp. BYS78W]|uniref:SPOR domain-containing protein n=1 Tax=Pelomonas candidula TaxID=3299025 RepID=A0ABW7HK30_9BURK
MERLPEQIVDWHNRHPLARRIGVGDVHTVGVVALPFVRATAQAGGVVEPVLTDVVSAFDDLHGMPPVSRWAVWSQKLKGLTRLLPGRPRQQQWRAFSEKFLPGLSPSRIERFALAHGYTEPPATPESQPWRVIVIDEKLAATHSGWPFELYLMSAGIDTGSARTRVLCGRGIPSQIVGRRLWDPIRAGGAAAALALLVAIGAWLLWPHPAAEPVAPPEVAASAPEAVASAPVEAPSAPAGTEPAASAPPVAASGPAEAAASAAEPAASQAADQQPDIRPHLVERNDGIKRPPLLSSGKAAVPDKPAETPTDKAIDKTPEKASGKPADKATEPASKAEPADPRLARMAEAPNQVAVALVGPAGSKADAEALLKKMKEGLKGVHSNPDSLQADVIQTPEGWRATIWPFPSREQAQLINATLVARGLKTKAVNF